MKILVKSKIEKFNFFYFFQIFYNIYSPNVNFSPESGGSVNPNKAIDDISTHGTIKLKK